MGLERTLEGKNGGAELGKGRKEARRDTRTECLEVSVQEISVTEHLMGG